MQRVEDFSELFRLKQSRQKHAEQSKPWEEAQSSDAFTRPFIYKQIPVIVRKKGEQEEEPDRKPYSADFPVHRGAARQ